jgi:heme exporter protein C
MFLSDGAPLRGLYSGFKNKDWRRYCSPQGFYPLARALPPWFAAAALLLCTLGMFMGFFVAPADAQQGEAYRIIYIHVPAAWLSMLIYLLLALCAGAGLVFNARLAPMAALALAPTGAMFAFLTLWSGALWAKPIWGTWWIWDMRLISEFVLLILYAGFIATHVVINDTSAGDRAGAALVLVGLADVPVNAFSVQWWTTLQPGASVGLNSPPSMALAVLAGMLTMAAGFFLYACAVVLLRLRCVILERERSSDWVNRQERKQP